MRVCVWGRGAHRRAGGLRRTKGARPDVRLRCLRDRRGERLRRTLTEPGRFRGKPTMLSCRSGSSAIGGVEGGGLPTAAVESDRKLRGLGQHEFSVSQFYINSPTWTHRTKIKILRQTWWERLWGRRPFPCLFWLLEVVTLLGAWPSLPTSPPRHSTPPRGLL